ncbi:hypothetical protein FY557_04850 [Chryseobacterium sp. SN22]|uniref:hypothetical protein n=1 Tax=Chryseobacterium sp. SN22 TaxID=2606431 RepID=UPI0011EDB1A8|nr:hypothetical protein [Chryseobacterium sp. SN22]KAA0129631.1 hypothetical protein FY557_04850 [Chryseobacterium sp. SN22]
MLQSRYEITDNGKIFSFRPNRYSIRLSVGVLIIILVLTVLLIAYFDRVNQGAQVLFAVLAPYLILQSLYDILIRSKISYVFNRESRMLYRKMPLFPKKKLMSSDEIVIFTSRACRYWHYRVGAKKSHLVKSYRISGDFKDSKEKSAKEIDYEKEILNRLYELLNK